MLTMRLVIVRGKAHESVIHGSRSHVLQAEPIAVDETIIAMAPGSTLLNVATKPWRLGKDMTLPNWSQIV